RAGAGIALILGIGEIDPDIIGGIRNLVSLADEERNTVLLTRLKRSRCTPLNIFTVVAQWFMGDYPDMPCPGPGVLPSELIIGHADRTAWERRWQLVTL